MVPKTYFHHNSSTENGSIVIAPEGKQEIGLVAQEMYEIVPEVVSKPENEQAELWVFPMRNWCRYLLEPIQEQQEMIDNQQKSIESLMDEVEKFRRINDFESLAINN